MTKTTIEALKAHKRDLQNDIDMALDRLKAYTKRIEEYQLEIIADQKRVDEYSRAIAEITQDLG